MITDTTRLALLLFCDQMGQPLAATLTADRLSWCERVTERLVAAHGDALDVLTADTVGEDRILIEKAAALMRSQFYSPEYEE